MYMAIELYVMDLMIESLQMIPSKQTVRGFLVNKSITDIFYIFEWIQRIKFISFLKQFYTFSVHLIVLQ